MWGLRKHNIIFDLNKNKLFNTKCIYTFQFSIMNTLKSFTFEIVFIQIFLNVQMTCLKNKVLKFRVFYKSLVSVSASVLAKNS